MDRVRERLTAMMENEVDGTGCDGIHGDFHLGKQLADCTAKMPFWTNVDTRNTLLSSLIPSALSLGGLAFYSADKGMLQWWEELKKPAIVSRVNLSLSSCVDVLTVTPLGYASYLVYKHGGGFDYNDTRLALGLYATNLSLAALTIPLMKKKNINLVAGNTVLIHLTAIATAIAFYKIHHRAGYWMAPYAIWTAAYAIITQLIKKENEPVKDI